MTPVRVAALSVVVNIALSLLLMQHFAHVGLAMATSIASWLNAVLLAVLLHRRRLYRFDAATCRRLLRILPPSGVMAAALYGLALVLAPWIQGPAWQAILALSFMVASGLAVFAGAAVLLGAVRPDELRTALRLGGPRS